MKKIFEPYQRQFKDSEVKEKIAEATDFAKNNINKETLKQIFSFIDLTSLNITDTREKIAKMTTKVNELNTHFEDLPQVAGICVYPNFIEVVKENLKVQDVKIVSVAGAFPSSQTFINIKTAEVREAIYHGAEEIDIVIALGEFLAEDYAHVFHELKKMRKNASDVHLKVILETGLLQDYEKIYKASILAMEAGADFIKTSTGKEKIGATPEAVYVMANAAKDFYAKKGKMVGIKPAGGVSTSEKAMTYIKIIENVLGKDWLTPDLFRIGTSSLANAIIKELYGNEKYF